MSFYLLREPSFKLKPSSVWFYLQHTVTDSLLVITSGWEWELIEEKKYTLFFS